MNHEFYSSKRVLVVRRPPLPFSVVQIAGGVAIALLTVSGVFLNLGVATDLWNRYSDFADQTDRLPNAQNPNMLMWGAYMLALGILVLIMLPMAVRGVLFGIKFVLVGARETVRPWMPSNIPLGFKNYYQTVVENGFKRRQIATYGSLSGHQPSFLTSIFGRNALFLSPAQRGVAEANARALRGQIVNIVFAVILAGAALGAASWLGGSAAQRALNDNLPSVLRDDLQLDYALGAINAVMRWLTAEEARDLIPRPFFWLVGMQIAVAAIEFASTTIIIPPRQPNTVAEEGSEHYRGFGHPGQLFTRLPILAQALAWKDFPNRAETHWREAGSLAVGNVGTFSGHILIEQQPQPTRTPSLLSAYILFMGGWAMRLVGYYLLFFEALPGPMRDLANNDPQHVPFLYAPLYALVMGSVAAQMARNGKWFIEQAERLFNIIRFRSVATLIEITGNQSRADVRVGKAMEDSIESSSVVVRSDFTANFWAAELVSEAASLDEERDLLALETTKESRSWLDYLRNQINELRDEGVRPVGIDLEAPEVSGIVQANVGVSSSRAGTVERARLSAASEYGALPGQTPVPGQIVPPPSVSQIQPPPSPAPAPPATPVPDATPQTAGEIQQYLDQLDAKLIRGDITQGVYEKLYAKWEGRLEHMKGAEAPTLANFMVPSEESPVEPSDAESPDEA
jgi:hypothetical protein